MRGGGKHSYLLRVYRSLNLEQRLNIALQAETVKTHLESLIQQRLHVVARTHQEGI